MQTTLHDNPKTLVFRRQRSSRNSNEVTQTGTLYADGVG